MRAVIQRVSSAKVTIDNNKKSEISKGLLVLIGIEEDDDQTDIEWLARKVTNQRIFSDEEGKMNMSVKDIDGHILLISQFTLHASVKKGNRPSFMKAAHPDKAVPLYKDAITAFSEALGKPVKTGEFGADMQVSLTNDGPVTIIMDSKNKE